MTSHSVHDLVVFFDNNPNLQYNVSPTVQLCFYQIIQLKRAISALNVFGVKTL